MKNYNIFVKECKFWIEKLHIDNWGVDYECCIHSTSDDPFASVGFNQDKMKASMTFYSKKNEKRSIEEIKNTAKHEVMHLIFARLDDLAHSRCVNRKELECASEEIVQKITKDN